MTGRAQRPATLGSMRFELAAHLSDRILERAAEVGAEPRHAGPLLFAWDVTKQRGKVSETRVSPDGMTGTIAVSW